MPAKTSTDPAPPPVGTLIDNGTLELVEVLGIGGYGVVYRALDVSSTHRTSYAVKCLMHTRSAHSARQRQLHIREITLHQLASVHPSVVSLYRVIEESECTYLIMEYAYDGDLFSQILHNSRYLGDDLLIKHVFLQLLDAVEHCHALGIYHRDLKPENVLCFEGGLRIAITDFGLATTEKLSSEFRTGSIYHMSPECQGGAVSEDAYSPMANDIWSLAIILLNLATGRNPWKSAATSDPTFQAYVQDPLDFLPTVLPISQEANAILVKMLDLDWKNRISLRELRRAIRDLETFYSDDAIFEGSMARCPWEAGMDMGSEGGEEDANGYSSSTKGDSTEQPEKEEELKSFWSHESESEMILAVPERPRSIVPQASWMEYSPHRATWGLDSPVPSSEIHTHVFDDVRSPSVASHAPRPSHSPLSSSDSGSLSPPRTPRSVNMPFVFSAGFADDEGEEEDRPRKRPLTVDTDVGHNHRSSYLTTSDLGSSMAQTPFDSCDRYSFLPSAVSSKRFRLSIVGSPMRSDLGEDREMEDIAWTFSATDVAESIRSMYSTTDVDSEENVSPDMSVWREVRMSIVVPSPVASTHPDVVSEALAPPEHQKKTQESKKLSALFTNMRFTFPRSQPSSPAPRAHTLLTGEHPSEESFDSCRTSSRSTDQQGWAAAATRAPDGGLRKRRHTRHWFSPARLFSPS